MVVGQRGRAGQSARRGRFGTIATLLLAAAILAVSAVFTWLRVELPSEPAVISSDTWPWTAEGVGVVPLGPSGQFAIGDIVAAVGGQPVAAWAADPLAPRPSTPLPSELGFDVIRDNAHIQLQVALGPQPIAGLVLGSLPLFGYTLVQAIVALLAWQRRPSEAWRRGFLLGASADLASAVIWELGLRPSDLIRPAPMVPLFLLAAPLQLVFWSSVMHVMVSWPRRWDLVAGRQWAVAALYVVPQIALLGGVAIGAAIVPVPLEWVGSWDQVLAAIVLVMIVLVLVALARAFLRTPARRDAWLRVVTAACLAGALAVGTLTVLPILLIGHPLFGRSEVAALGLPLAVVLIVGALRSRLFEVDVLLASRRRLVVAREEERRRIRRDLHDGIGPMLAAMTLKVDLARDVLRSDPEAADKALSVLKADTQAALAEIRRLTRDLRPPALDELGVVQAIRQRADELSAGAAGRRVAIEVTSVGQLPPLDAAAEAAAYRIAVEAMTNVVRHANAEWCRVRLWANGALVIEISDDGVGFADGRGVGVGMTSMRERCAELGGSLSVERTPEGRTVVVATLPTSG